MDEPTPGTPGTFGTIDASDPAQVAEYEGHFYQAYAALTDNTLVRLIWDWDDAAQRLRARIPYADQVIYCLRDDHGRLAGAMAVNVNPAPPCRAPGSASAWRAPGPTAPTALTTVTVNS
jgi:hypothetical protein